MEELRRAGEALAERVLGQTEADAQALAAAEGVPLRVVNRDGKALLHRLDLRPGRLNVAVLQGKVTAVRVEHEPGG